LSWKPLVIPNALVVVGPWGDEFRWREALHAQGIRYDDAYRAHNVYHRPFVQMHRMPASAAEYRRYSVIVLADVDAPALGEERLAVLSDFVNDGGGLIVLGGYWAFQRGGYAGTPLAEMLPVRWTEKDDLRAHPGGALLAAATQATWKLEAKFASAPRAFYLHDFAAKENTTVQLIA
jgi:uncharacterized membrane protein